MRTICEANHQSCLQGNLGREAVEFGTFILISRLPFNNTQDMLEAARVGRLDYGSSQVVGGDVVTVLLLGAGLCQPVYSDCPTPAA